MRQVRALMLGITLIALMVACGGYVLIREVNSSAGTSTEPVTIEIYPGETTTDIATKLRAADLIRQPMLFTILVRMQGLDTQLQAGLYMLRPTMTMREILLALQHSRVGEVEILIHEGLRLEEIAERIRQSGIASQEAFLQAARNGAAFKENHFLLSSLPADASLEGYLYPDTYRFNATTTVTDVIETMLTRFDQQYATIERDVHVPDVSVHQIVTMASIVQRESALIDEMPKIAAVFWNRLKPEHLDETGGGKLQSDASLQYALGYSMDEQTWWRKTLTVADLSARSPYNTRERNGLPPGPIASPGLDALRAAAKPDETDYLYFVVNCALDGSHNFAQTFAEFQQYEAEYLACSAQ